MNFRKLWNDRIFRTFLQAAIGAACGAIADSKSVAFIVTIAVSAGLAAIMPLLEVEDED